MENEITGSDCTVGVAILSNLNETPEEGLVSREGSSWTCHWEIANAHEKADRHPRGCGIPSQTFELGSCGNVSLEFFPNGNAFCRCDKTCSIAVNAPAGTEFTFVASVGGSKAGAVHHIVQGKDDAAYTTDLALSSFARFEDSDTFVIRVEFLAFKMPQRVARTNVFGIQTTYDPASRSASPQPRGMAANRKALKGPKPSPKIDNFITPGL